MATSPREMSSDLSDLIVSSGMPPESRSDALASALPIVSAIRSLVPATVSIELQGSLLAGTALRGSQPDLDVFLVLRARTLSSTTLKEFGLWAGHLLHNYASGRRDLSVRCGRRAVRVMSRFHTPVDFVPMVEATQTKDRFLCLSPGGLFERSNAHRHQEILQRTWGQGGAEQVSRLGLLLRAWTSSTLPKQSQPSATRLLSWIAELYEPADSDLRAIAHILDGLRVGPPLATSRAVSRLISADVRSSWDSGLSSNVATAADLAYESLLGGSVADANSGEWSNHKGASDDGGLRVFVSSSQRESGLQRQAVVRALDGIAGVSAIVAERFIPHGSVLHDGIGRCTSKIGEADLFVGLYGAEYGSVSCPALVSPIHAEAEVAHSSVGVDRMMLVRQTDLGASDQIEEMLEGCRRGTATAAPLNIDGSEIASRVFEWVSGRL